MPRTKGSKNRPKTNTTQDYASQIAEKQSAKETLSAEIGNSIRTEKKITDENEVALKAAIVEFKETFVTSEGR